MLSKISSFALSGVNGYPVDIEIDINPSMPSYDVVGLPDTAIKESRERVHSAIKNSGYEYPIKKIIINLAPADTRKEGAVFDLAIAIGILSASEQIPLFAYKDFIILGELSLDGSVRKIYGLLPLLIAGSEYGFKKYIVPQANAKEAGFISDIEVYPVANLREAVEFLRSEFAIEPIKRSDYVAEMHNKDYSYDFKDVKGQSIAKRALEIAVAGGHNALMIGPPGAGKTMLAKCVPGIMPPMTFEEAIEVTKIHSIAGILDANDGIVKCRPFRTPHHTASVPALTGGGVNSRPGEISMAHNGVLFLDEMPEYSRKTLETLRQPLEDGCITVSRAKQTLEYPSDFMLIASMNPCPCGNFGSGSPCKCSAREIHNYVNKLSGPLIDRIDLQVEVDSISYSELRNGTVTDSSETIRLRVSKARQIQSDRFKDYGIHTNSQMNNALIKKFCAIDVVSDKILEMAFEKLSLSARAGVRILKVARTIADLAGDVDIKSEHISEAIQYRSLDRKYWE